MELVAGDRAYDNDDLVAAKATLRQGHKSSRPKTLRRRGPGAHRPRRQQRAHGLRRSTKNAQILALVRRLDAALKLDPNYAPAYVERGRLLLILGSAPEALNALDRATHLAPDDAETQSALAWRCSPPESQRRR